MNKTIIFVPHWIEKALVRNQRNLRDIVNYSVLRNFISKNDLSGLLGFQQAKEVDVLNSDSRTKSTSSKNTSGNSLLSRWEISAGDTYREELDSTVIPMSHSLEKETLERLVQSTDSADENNKLFKVIDIEKDSMVVVLYEGFLEGIEKPEVKYSLVKQLLTLSYVYCEVEKVSSTPLFRTYIDLLSSSTMKARTASTVE